MKTLVIGAGIVGVSVAYSLLRRGHAVTLIEAEGIAAGTTSTSYAWINSHKKHPDSYHVLNDEGRRHWADVIAAEHPAAVEFNGHVEVASGAEHRADLARRVERLQSLRYPARWITPEQARELVPVRIPHEALVAFFPGEGHAYPRPLVSARVESMHRNPAFELLIDPVVSVSAHQGRVTTRSGKELEGDAVVLAAGHATSQIAATAGIAVPMVPAESGGAAFGYLGYAEMAGHGLRGPVTSDHLNLRPDGADGLILQALDLDGTADPDRDAPPGIGAQFMARLRHVMPEHPAHLKAVRVGHRVVPADGLTVAGPAIEDAHNRLWIAATHSGIVLGPWLGEVLAEEITAGARDPRLADFRPSRFAGPGAVAGYAAPRKPGDQ